MEQGASSLSTVVLGVGGGQVREKDEKKAMRTETGLSESQTGTYLESQL